MILIACTGIFLPLEVALNQAWGVAKSRNYLFNQAIAFGLAILMAVLALLSMIVTVWVKSALGCHHFPQHQWHHHLDFRWHRLSLPDDLQRRGGDPVPFLRLLRAAEPQSALAAGFARFNLHGPYLAAGTVPVCHGDSSHRSEHVRAVLCFCELAVLGVYFGVDPVCRSAVQRGAVGQKTRSSQ